MNEVHEEAVVRRHGPIFGVDQQRNGQKATVDNREPV